MGKFRKSLPLLFCVLLFLSLTINVNNVSALGANSFGYDTIGGSSVTVNANNVRGSVYTLSDDGVNVNSMSAYVYSIGGSTNFKFGVYNSSWYLMGESDPVSAPASATWVSADVDIDLDSGSYWLCMLGDGNFYIYRDAGAASQYPYSSATYPTFDNPESITGALDYKVSIYANYTTGPEPTPTPTATPGEGYILEDDAVIYIIVAVMLGSIIAGSLVFFVVKKGKQ